MSQQHSTHFLERRVLETRELQVAKEAHIEGWLGKVGGNGNVRASTLCQPVVLRGERALVGASCCVLPWKSGSSRQQAGCQVLGPTLVLPQVKRPAKGKLLTLS